MPDRAAKLQQAPGWLRAALRWLSIGAGDEPTHEDIVRRRVVTLAWPAVVEGLFQTAIGVVDTFMVARVSDTALAGVGTALQLVFIVVVVMSAISVGASVLVSQAIGAGDRDGACGLTKQALLAAALAALPISLFCVATASGAIALFGLEPDVARIATDYWRITGAAMIPIVCMFVVAGVLRGAGDTKTPMRATLIANLVNAVLGYALIFGKFGLPELEANGSAWASVAGRSVALAVMLIVLLRPRYVISIRGLRGWRPHLRSTRRMLGIGAPAALDELSWSISFAILTGVVAVLGTEALAAQRIAFNALSLAFLPGFGMSLAATALVGQSVGARDPRGGSLATRVSAQYAAVWMGGIGVVYFLAATPIMRAFSDEPGVVSTGADALRVLALSQPLWGLMFVYGGALRGTGDARSPLLINSLWNWASVGLSYLAVTTFGLGLASVWTMFLIVSPVALILFLRRLRRDPHLGRAHDPVELLPPVASEEPAA